MTSQSNRIEELEAQNASLRGEVANLKHMQERYDALWRAVVYGNADLLIQACRQQVAVAQINTVDVGLDGLSVVRVSLPALTVTSGAPA